MCMPSFLHPGATSWLVTLLICQILNPKGFSKALVPFPLQRGGCLGFSGYLHGKGGASGRGNPLQLSASWALTPWAQWITQPEVLPYLETGHEKC